METSTEDYLCCTATDLLKTIDAVLKQWDMSKGKANITGEAAAMMSPEVIERMKGVKKQIEGTFL